MTGNPVMIFRDGYHEGSIKKAASRSGKQLSRLYFMECLNLHFRIPAFQNFFDFLDVHATQCTINDPVVIGQ